MRQNDAILQALLPSFGVAAERRIASVAVALRSPNAYLQRDAGKATWETA
jgi:hypothetical protein